MAGPARRWPTPPLARRLIFRRALGPCLCAGLGCLGGRRGGFGRAVPDWALSRGGLEARAAASTAGAARSRVGR